MTAFVGPVLETTEVGRSVAAAIRELNADVEFKDRGAYVRVLSRDRCVLTAVAVERLLGRRFRLPSDLELVMPSFAGKFTVTDEMAVWETAHR